MVVELRILVISLIMRYHEALVRKSEKTWSDPTSHWTGLDVPSLFPVRLDNGLSLPFTPCVFVLPLPFAWFVAVWFGFLSVFVQFGT